MITGIKLISINVDDQDRALEFYTQKLDFELLDDQPMGEGERWIEVAPPGGGVILALTKEGGAQSKIGKSVQIEFKCDDIQSTYEKLRSKGVNFTAELEEAPWGGWAAQFTDTEGNEYVLGS
jgi:predicted enzyme related to lactoylglutathione lyase